jgi:photosystem II stability/assembly factor-like uncharacterized protein
VSTAWEWLGPGNVGGRTRSLVFHPEDHAMMYAAGVSGGVWKTENAGGLWRPLADNMANINIGALVIDYQEPNTLYAGTGELYRKTTRPYSSMTGAGIFKTTDGGETWFQLSATVNEQFTYVSDLVISPNDHRRLYAATNSGVWRSDDGGINFSHVLNPTDGSGNSRYEGCNDLSIRTDVDDDWLLVSCASRSTDDRYYLPGLLPTACDGPCDARVYLNTEAQSGGNWEVVLTEPGMGRTQMTIHQANQNIMYASSANTDGGPDLNGDGQPDLPNGLHAVFRSDDGGQSWQAQLRNTTSNLLNTQLFSYADNALNHICHPGREPYYYSAGWYNQAIAASPIDPNEVWVGGMEIYRSNDGGKSFGLASHWDAVYSNNTAFHKFYVHADQHGLIFHPEYNGQSNKTLYAINDGGVYLTDDDSRPVQTGNTAPCQPSTNGIQWRSINNNYGITQFYAGAVFSDGQTYMAGAQDNGTILGSDATGANQWTNIGGGDGGDLAINPEDDNNFYISLQNAKIYRTNDGGVNYHNISPNLYSSGALFITPYEIDPNHPDRLFLGGIRLWRSEDRGDDWQISSPLAGAAYNALISALAVAPGDSNQVLYGNKNSIFKLNNALAESNQWQVTTTRPRGGWVSSLTYQPGSTQVAYATYSTFGGQHVWKTTNGGLDWHAIDGTGIGALPDIPVHKLVVDPSNPQRLYIGTDLGVFVTLDGGANWMVENTGYSQVITEDLVIKQVGDGSTHLFAFTYGRGVWRVPLADLDGLPDLTVSDDVSGLWYNSSQSGHGLQLEVLNLNGTQSLLAAWFVYLDGEPIWLIGLGDVVGNRAEINMEITSNTGFPVNDFNSNEIEHTPWGQLTFEFDSDHTAQLIWSSELPGFNNGSMSIERFTQIANNQNNGAINGCHSGSWYDPSQDGHGFMAEVLPAETGFNMTITWYTYVDGKQLWMVGTAPVNGDTVTFQMLTGSGSSFPTAFNSNDVAFITWGDLTFTLLSDNLARVNWHSELAGFPDGEIEVSRLTQLSGVPCL